MALDLDSRQRAMLQEMGITVWWPKPAPPADAVAAPATALAPAAPSVAAPSVELSARNEPHAVAAPSPTAQAAATHAPAARPAPQPETAEVSPAPAIDATWRLSPPVQAYPQAAASEVVPEDAWLVLWEGPHPAAPLSGDTGKLLDNMLRALRLHHNPNVWIASVQRPGADNAPLTSLPSQPVDWQPLQAVLPTHMAQRRPARMLVLGVHAARAVPGSQEALGRLRAQIHEVQGTPVVVSYDPAYLMRAPHAKPAAWADLCRAHALRPPSAPSVVQ